MASIHITTTYTTCGSATIDLGDKTWDDIADWYIKWDIFHYVLKGETEWQELLLDTCPVNDGTDWKRPESATIWEDESWEVELGEQ